jgi:hypothetical protein
MTLYLCPVCWFSNPIGLAVTVSLALALLIWLVVDPFVMLLGQIHLWPHGKLFIAYGDILSMDEGHYLAQ